MAAELTPRDRWAVETMRRQRALMDEAIAAAGHTKDPESSCQRWLAVQRQAAGYERYLQPWRHSVFERVATDIGQHLGALRGFQARSLEEVRRVDDAVRCRAERSLGLSLAVVGKGGAGKSVLVATMARLLARQGRHVLAVDLDTNPGLAFSLGLPFIEAGLPLEAIEQDPGANYGWQLSGHVTPDQVVRRFSALGPDGVHYLGVGKIGSLGKEAAKRSVAALVQVLLGFDRPDWDVVADLEAGPTTPFERYHAFASDTAVVVGPSWRSAMTARRLWPMVESQRPVVVANRFRNEPDHPGLPAPVRIPFDPCVAEAERSGMAPVDACQGAPAVRAIEELTKRALGAI